MTERLPARARIAAACAIAYACGYVTGSLLIGPRHDRATLALGIVRTVAGLMRAFDNGVYAVYRFSPG